MDADRLRLERRRQFDQQPQRLAEAAASRQPVAGERIDAPLAAQDQQLVGGGGMGDEARPVAFLVADGCRGFLIQVIRHRPQPALLRAQQGDRLSRRRSRRPRHRRDRPRGTGDSCPPAAERRLRPEAGTDRRHLLANAAPQEPVVGEQRVEPGALRQQAVALGDQRDLLQLAQLAQPHVQHGVGLHLVEAEARHQRGLRIILLADDADHLVEVEMDDEEAGQQLEALLDPAAAVQAAPAQHLAAVGQPGAQQLPQVEDPRRRPVHQHVEVDGDAHLQVGQPEQLGHDRLGVDRAAARLQHQADDVGGLRRGRRRGTAACARPAAPRAARSALPSAPARGSRRRR